VTNVSGLQARECLSALRSSRCDVLVTLFLMGSVACTTVLWHGASRFQMPAAYIEQPEKSDTLFHLAVAKAAAAGELIPLTWKTPRDLNAPYTANWNDWPLVEEVPAFLIGMTGRCLGLFAGFNVASTVAQALAAAGFFFAARRLGALRLWAAIGSLAYSLAPFIFAQNPHHPFVANVWQIPLAVLVFRWVSTADGFAHWRHWLPWGVAVGFVIGMQNVYYTNIFCQLTLLGAAALAWRMGSWAPVKPAVAVLCGTGAAFALMNVDTWTYRAVQGSNPGALVREYKWLEIYGLKIVDLVIPPVTHRAEPFATFAAAHRAAAPLLDEGSYVGLVGIAALGLLVVAAVRALVLGRADDVPPEAWATLWIILAFTTGGLNAIIGACGLTLFRTGCRYSIVILCLALLYAARRLSDWQRDATARASGSGHPTDAITITALTAAGGLVAVILWDQVPRPPTAELRATIDRQVAADREFTEKMEAALPEGAMVFQLPVMEFPESPVAGVPPYDHFRPYLFSKHLRFSFGSHKGREREKWQPAVQAKFFEGATVDQEAGMIGVNQTNARMAVDELKKLGFSAIYVNRNGFPDRGKGIEDALLELGYTKPPIRNATGDLACIILENDDADADGKKP
jgi:hypothetical protein